MDVHGGLLISDPGLQHVKRLMPTADRIEDTHELLILTLLLVGSICIPGLSLADLEGVVKDERAALSHQGREKRHPAPRIATAINMAMELFCWRWGDRQDHIGGIQRASRLRGGLRGSEETRIQWMLTEL